MSLRWYQQHLQAIVKENELLKFQNQKKIDEQHNAILTVCSVFQELFPDVPEVEAPHANNLNNLLEYYRKIGSKWIEMVNQKLQLIEEPPLAQNTQTFLQKISEQVNLWASKREGQRCVLCGNIKDRAIYGRLMRKIGKLHSNIVQLQAEIQELQEEVEKYLKEISYLRSITKKLEFQLAQQIMVSAKIDKAYQVKSRNIQAELKECRKQAQIWKEEYDRFWQEQHSKIRTSGKDSTFEEEIALLNTLYRQEKEIVEYSNSQSHCWITQNNSIQPTTFSDKKEDEISLPTTSRQYIQNIK